jgi:hypothetical protein
MVNIKAEVNANPMCPITTSNASGLDFATSLPQSQPVASVVMERDKLLQALAGQDRHVRLAFFAQDQTLELSSAGAYALVMPLVGLEEEDFWRPEIPGD